MNPFGIRWKNPDGVKLKDLPRSKGNWYYSVFYSLLQVIVGELKMKPSEFDLCDPEDDLKVMTAYLLSRSRMTEQEQKQAEKERGRKGRLKNLFSRKK